MNPPCWTLKTAGGLNLTIPTGVSGFVEVSNDT